MVGGRERGEPVSGVTWGVVNLHFVTVPIRLVKCNIVLSVKDVGYKVVCVYLHL